MTIIFHQKFVSTISVRVGTASKLAGAKADSSYWRFEGGVGAVELRMRCERTYFSKCHAKPYSYGFYY